MISQISDATTAKRIKIDQYCSDNIVCTLNRSNFLHAFASRGFVSDSWAFLFIISIVKDYSNTAVIIVQCYHNIIQTFTVFMLLLGNLHICSKLGIEHSSKWISTPFSRRYNNRRLKICLLVAVKSLLQCFHLKTLLSFQSMTSENLCEPSPILAPLGEILCEPLVGPLESS